MTNRDKGLLSKGFVIDEKYTVVLFIKKGINAETYRVKSKNGKVCFLKLIDYSKLHHTAFNVDNDPTEIEILKAVKHPNLAIYKDSGELIHGNKRFGYVVLSFIAGETIDDRIRRESINSWYDIKQIAAGVLEGLKYLHGLPNPIIHNDITPSNVMLDLSTDIPTPKIIDFGYARYFNQSLKSFPKHELNKHYIAPEGFNNVFSTQSDLFSVGVIMYQLVFGTVPWVKQHSRFSLERSDEEDLTQQERSKPLQFPEPPDAMVDFDESVVPIIRKALGHQPDTRFQSADDFLKAIRGDLIESEDTTTHRMTSEAFKSTRQQRETSKGRGFDAIAGMADLKAQLQLDVIDALHNPEEYAKYGITIPNGMLLYGPPGCGKTFFAKHFAEEVGFNFIHVNPGTLKSKWVNATEEKIAKLFRDAEENAPTILFIEEISGLFPSRDSDVHEMSKNAVEAMLAEMDRTGEKGIFVLCATNYPNKIDPALLRAGRLDKKFYMPPPDHEARKALFEMHLKSRPIDFGIDYDRLASMTQNYVSSDIKDLIVDEASRVALKKKDRITMEILEDVIGSTIPSVPVQELEKYEKIRAAMNAEIDTTNTKAPRIGF